MTWIRKLLTDFTHRAKILAILAMVLCLLVIGILKVSEDKICLFLDIFLSFSVFFGIVILWKQKEQNDAIMSYLKNSLMEHSIGGENPQRSKPSTAQHVQTPGATTPKYMGFGNTSEDLKRSELLKEVVLETESIYKSLQKLTAFSSHSLSFKSLSFGPPPEAISLTVEQLSESVKNNKIQLLGAPVLTWPQKKMLYIDCTPYVDLETTGTINLCALRSTTEHRAIENLTEQLIFLRSLQFIRRYSQSYKQLSFAVPLLKGCFDKNFLEEINDMLTKTRFPSSHTILTLPFLQASYLNEDGSIWNRLQRLRQRGIQVLLDVDIIQLETLSANFSVIKEVDYLRFKAHDVQEWLYEKDYAKRYEKFKGYMSFSPKIIFKDISIKQELYKLNFSPDGYQGGLAGPSKGVNEVVSRLT
ncbi:MAG TPA: EAL domain-containing protein [Alphaproteobacteria bacterium]|nr:EAL domain-containing protein [Alphaproteobacteria bacterium]